MAETLDVSLTTYQRWEQGRLIPSLETLNNIADILNTDILNIIGLSKQVIDQDNIEIGNRIKKAREDSNIVLTALSDILDIPVSRLRQFEAGKEEIPAYMIPKISAALGTTNTFLLENREVTKNIELDLNDIENIIKIYHDYIETMKVKKTRERAKLLKHMLDQYNKDGENDE